MRTDYFSDRERGRRPRDSEEIDDRTWRGLKALIETELRKDAFAEEFPINCDDGNGVCGTDTRAFTSIMEAEIPDLNWPLPRDLPDQLAALDLLEFCHKYISYVENKEWHDFFRHEHLEFERLIAPVFFRKQVNGMFGVDPTVRTTKEPS